MSVHISIKTSVQSTRTIPKAMRVAKSNTRYYSTVTEVNNCFNIYPSSKWLATRELTLFSRKCFTKAIFFGCGCSEVKVREQFRRCVAQNQSHGRAIFKKYLNLYIIFKAYKTRSDMKMVLTGKNKYEMIYARSNANEVAFINV